jgi:hypothetical protein
MFVGVGCILEELTVAVNNDKFVAGAGCISRRRAKRMKDARGDLVV